jgi:hypothetical protein
MVRLIGLLLLALLVWRCIQAVVRLLRIPDVRASPSREPVVKLVRCGACGLYIARSRALLGEGSGAGEAYCSEACRRRAEPAPAAHA